MARTSTKSVIANRRLMAQIRGFVTSVKTHWHDPSGRPVYPSRDRAAIPARTTAQGERPPRAL